MILKIVAIKDLECESFDIIAAFLNVIILDSVDMFIE